MKSKIGILFAAVVLSVTMIGLGHSRAYAQTDEVLKANIPFSFNAGKQVMPAGTYTIGVDVQNDMVEITNAEGRNLGLLLGTTSGYGGTESSLVFDHTSDGQYYLKALKSDLIDLSIPAKEKQTADEAANRTSPEQVEVSMVR